MINETGRRDSEPTGGRVVVGFVQRELERIEVALRCSQGESAYRELYAAQQALSWAMEPNGFKTPFETISEGLIQAPIKEGIPVG